MTKTKHIMRLEEASCANCLFCDTILGHKYCSRDSISWGKEDESQLFSNFCSYGAWFVTSMDLVHNAIQVHQYFNIKEKQEAEEALLKERPSPEV